MSLDLHPLRYSGTGHSSTVSMSLHLGTEVYPVLQSSATAIKLGDIRAVKGGDAVLEISVDGRLHRRAIRVLGPGERAGWLAITQR
jgi:hypothetical protein